MRRCETRAMTGLTMRVVERLQQRRIDHVRLHLVGDAAEQLAQALARIGDALDLRRDTSCSPYSSQRSSAACSSASRVAEVPVEAALGDAEPARERFDRERADALLRRSGPARRASQSSAVRRTRSILGGVAVIAACVARAPDVCSQHPAMCCSKTSTCDAIAVPYACVLTHRPSHSILARMVDAQPAPPDIRRLERIAARDGLTLAIETFGDGERRRRRLRPRLRPDAPRVERQPRRTLAEQGYRMPHLRRARPRRERLARATASTTWSSSSTTCATIARALADGRRPSWSARRWADCSASPPQATVPRPLFRALVLVDITPRWETARRRTYPRLHARAPGRLRNVTTRRPRRSRRTCRIVASASPRAQLRTLLRR